MELLNSGALLKPLQAALESKEPINKAMLHQAILAQKMWRRQKSGSTKNRAEVHGTTKKSVKQKGSGGARHGALTAPQFVGGGVCHGPRPILAAHKMNKTMLKSALIDSLRARLSETKIYVLSGDEKATGKTKEFAKLLKGGDIKSALVCGPSKSMLLRAVRNVPRVKGIAPEGLNPYDVLSHTAIIIAGSSVETVSSRLSGVEPKKEAKVKKK
jgi:large subunit ribosomal protein L4